MVRLMYLMKNRKEEYVRNKAYILSAEEVRFVLKKLDDDKPKELLPKIGIVLLFFGLLHQGEVQY